MAWNDSPPTEQELKNLQADWASEPPSEEELKVVSGVDEPGVLEQIVKVNVDALPMYGQVAGSVLGGGNPAIAGAGQVVGESVKDALYGAKDIYDNPKKFIDDLSQLPTKEQVISQVNKYLNSFSQGAVSEKGGQLIAKGIGAAADKIAPAVKKVAEPMKEKAYELAVRATGATGKQAEKFSPSAGKELLERKLVQFGDSPPKIAERTGQALEDAGEVIDAALKELDRRGVKVSANEAVNVLERRALELSKDPAQAGNVRQIRKIIDDIIETGEASVKISDAEKTKQGFNSISKDWRNEKSGIPGKTAYRAYKDLVEKEAIKADPTLGAAFKDAKVTHGLLKDINKAAIQRTNQLNQQPVGGLLDTTAALGGAAMGEGGRLAGAATGAAVAVARRTLAPRISAGMAVSYKTIADQLLKLPEYAKINTNNPAVFGAIVNGLVEEFRPVGSPQSKWIDNGIKKLDRLGEIPTSLNEIRKDKKVAELLIKASNATSDEQLKRISEQIRNTEAFKKAPKGGPKTSNKYPMTLRQNGFKVTVKNDQDYYEARSEGWA